jgi:tetratricopeptide (TPR) repeat protein
VALAATDDPVLRAELNAIYQRLLLDPSDRALNRRMIDIAVELGDYDAAIGAVERLIFYDPNDAALQVEAARYYLAIKSYAAASGYLSDATALPDLSAEQIAQISDLTREAERGAHGSPWSGFGQVGVRYQTNANIGSVQLGLNEPFPFEKPEPDWNAFALGTLGLDAFVSPNVTVEGSLSGYYADQFKIDRLDLGFAEIVLGPRFSTDTGALSVRPYGLAQGILLGSAPYQAAYGAGATARWFLAPDWFIEPQFEYKSRDFYNTADYPDASTQTGELYTYAVNFGGALSDSVGFIARAGYNTNAAVTDYESYDQYFANLAFQIGFDALGKEGWVFSPFATVSTTNFKGIAPPETFAGFDTIREETFWGVGANVEIPLRNDIALGLGIEYNRNEANLDRDDYDNFKVVIGPQGRF